MTDLRPYQTECLQSVKTAYRAGLRRVLVSLPTGTGKTAGREEHATLAVSDELAKVVRHAERWVEENAPDSVKLVRRGEIRRQPTRSSNFCADGACLSRTDCTRPSRVEHKFIGEGHERSVRQAQ